jgi:hypothetical protein
MSIQVRLRSKYTASLSPARFTNTSAKLSFGSDTIRFTSNNSKCKSASPNVFKRFWHWFSNLPERFKAFLRNLFGFKPSTAQVVPLPKKPAKQLYSHIDPKLTNDPAERRRITAQLADETFEQIIALVQNKTVKKGPDGKETRWEELAGQVLTPVAQKLLNTNTELRFAYNDTPGMGLGVYSPPEKRVNGPRSCREELGQVMVIRPYDLHYNFSNPAHRQAFYTTFIHELHHMTRCYALDYTAQEVRAHKRPSKADPLEKSYTDMIVGNSIGGQSDVMKLMLAEENPHLPDVKAYYGHAVKEMDVKAIQGYWGPLQKMWQRTDFPLLNFSKSIKQRFDELLDKGDPAIIKEMVNDKLVEELESYMTCLRRAPGVPKDQLQPSDLTDLGAAMFLRDMIRYYYQHPKHQIPPNEQNPLAQVRPLKTLFEEYNA